ncbi:uncharacterized protein LOC101857321 [Aplysia californica]|uniref:Uncharacterized protein LOC101857321 n=1 Tax=Aplysia californica TaxID=6500 RepID=A0ABM0JJ93_APLCA|nr:uncharacterized protein LOC101857321 [Aplysia californica]
MVIGWKDRLVGLEIKSRSPVYRWLGMRAVSRATSLPVLPQSVRLSETYSLFAFVLARLFNEVEHWQSRCGRSRLEEFSLSTLEGWGVFNKLRVQHQVEELELMYVQCVARFVETSHPKLHLSFPQRYSALLEEVRQKLLHNLTSRTLRTHLLELLLQVHNQGVPLMSHRTSGTDVATQTDGQAVNERDRDGHRADSRAAARVAEQTNEMATRGSVGFYRPPRGSLNPRADPFVPHVFPSEIEEGDSAQLLSPPDGAEYSGEVPVLPLDNVKSIVGHGGSHTCTALRDVDGAELENCLESSKSNNLPPLKESSSVGKIHHSSHHAIDRRRKFPKSLLQLPPRLLQKCMTDSHLFLKGAGTHNSHAANTSSGHAADFDNNGHAADRDSDRAVSGDSGRAAHSRSKVVHFRQREAETGSKSFSPPQELDFSNTAESEEMTTGQTNGGCSLARTEDGYRCLELQSGVGQCGDGSEGRLDSALLYHHNRKNSFDGKGNERDSSEDQEHLLDQSKDYHVLIRPDGDFTYSVSGNSDLKHDKFDSTSDPEHTLEAAGHVGPLDEVMGSDCTAAPIRGLSERVVQHPTLPSSGGEVDECSRGMLPGTLTIGETGQVSRSQYGLSYSGDSWPVSDDDQLELNRDQVKSGDGQVRTFDSGSRKNDCETKGDFNQLGPDNGPARKELAVRNSQTVCKDQAGQNSKEGVQESLRGRELCKKMHLAYTPDELRALNPFSGDGMGQARVLNEFRDRCMTFLKGLPNAHELPIREPPGWVSKASKPTARYGCSGEAPVALSTVLGSDWMNWKKLSDLLPESKLGQQKVSAPSVLPTVGSSVDPAPYSSSLHANRSYATVQSQSDDSFDFHLGNSPHSDHKSSSLLDRGKSPHSDHKNSPLLDRGNSPHSDHKSSSLLDRGKNPHSDHKNSPLLDRVSSPLLDRGNNPHSDLENNPHSEGNNCAAKLQSPTEVWHQPMWPQDFFSSTKTATAPISNPANGDRKNLTSTRSKKKKTKFRPLSDFEVRVVKDEVEHSEPVGRPVREGGDPYGFDDDDDCEGDEDEFSEEMLQMYIQLEEAEQKKDSGQVLHLPRLGGTCDGPPRTSLFAKLRQQEQEREQRAREPWAPGKRFCSKCGGEGHMMYDCPQWNQVTST